MLFSRFAPAVAGLIGAAQALVPAVTERSDLVALGGKFDLGTVLDDKILFNGIAKPKTETEAAVSLALAVDAEIEGGVSLAPVEDFLKAGTLRLDLAHVKAYVEVKVSASAGVYQTVELIASPELNLDTGLLDLDLAAAFGLDLIVGVGAEVDLCAGFYVSFNEGDYLDLSVLTKEVVGKSLDGLTTKALPIGLGVGVDLSADLEIFLGLRLRSHVKIGAGVDLLGLDLLDAGAEVAIWADLMEHTITLVETDDCTVAVTNDFALSLGLAVNVGIDVLDLLDLSLAPKVRITLANTLGLKVCLGELPPFCGIPGIEPPTTSVSATPTPVPTIPSNGTITTGGLVTSTATTTHTYTITSCHASVPHCPADETQKVVTSTIVSSVVVCPAESTGHPAPTTTPTKKHIKTITDTLTTVVPCEPTSSTFTPRPSHSKVPPTVTISDSTTVCPEETGGNEQPPAPTAVPTGEVPASTTPATPAPTGPAGPGAPAPSSPEAPVAPAPSSPAAPVAPAPSSPGSPVAPVPVPSFTAPGNNTWTSVVPPASTWVPTPSGTPNPPPTAGAGSVKVGLALALPAVVAMML